MTPAEARQAARAAEERRQRAEKELPAATAGNVAPIDNGSADFDPGDAPPDHVDEPAEPAAPAAPPPPAQLVARVRAKALFIHGLGNFTQNQCVPINLQTAREVLAALNTMLADDTPSVVIETGKPGIPFMPSEMPLDADPFASREIAGIKRAKKDQINKRALELALAPYIEQAAQEELVKVNGLIEKRRAAAQAALDQLNAEPARRAVKLRAEADRLRAEADAADGQAKAAEQAKELEGRDRERYDLQLALQPFVDQSNSEFFDPKYSLVSPTLVAEFKGLVASAIEALQKDDLAAVRERIGDLSKLKSPTLRDYGASLSTFPVQQGAA